MNKTLKSILIGVAFLLLISVLFIGTYNKMVSLDQKVKRAQSDIDTQLQRRNDLIPNLVNTVKGYAAQEKDIFIEIANARAKIGGAKTVGEKANADNELSTALSRLLVVVERYPDLKSSANFRDLTVALEGTENRINIARQDYNRTVDTYNATIKKFPNFIIAGIFRFEDKEYYKAAEGVKEVPKVEFSR
ncbi:LemA family protein [Clostridium aestuarii]|uniref:LemA family protein n=1 Tax=Clostridium aestuarii TaxID=338193 RepID=A0ABT4CZS3_9CLOT|nr:LemA family protein [Clostridium aestuarii]MCY6484488.1 LemA family protein [Clostridium aestuarii]